MEEYNRHVREIVTHVCKYDGTFTPSLFFIIRSSKRFEGHRIELAQVFIGKVRMEGALVVMLSVWLNAERNK